MINEMLCVWIVRSIGSTTLLEVCGGIASAEFTGSLMAREHHAPVGALGLRVANHGGQCHQRQGAPRTCRYIETSRLVPLRLGEAKRQGAPRTCRCIETGGRIERGKEDKSSGACETRGTKPGPSTTPPPFHLLRPFPTATPLIPPLRPFSPYSEGYSAGVWSHFRETIL